MTEHGFAEPEDMDVNYSREEQQAFGVLGIKHSLDPIIIDKARKSEADGIAALASKMWEHPVEELTEEFASLLENREAAVFAAMKGSLIIGFAQCQLRHDYVEGTSTSPVAYLEGIYVEERFRRMGVARAMLDACEKWARSMGCSEFASDCELTNTDSLRFHQRLGFTEANRVICFTKSL